MSEGIFPLALTLASHALFVRDGLNGARKRLRRRFGLEAERVTFASGLRRIDAVHVSAGEDAPTVLICHGIGERLEYWAEVQRTLQWHRVSSLVFDYSGYGASTGRMCARHCEEDAQAAWRYLAERSTGRVFLLGFSLGTGVVAAIAGQVEVSGVVLCEGYTSMREAAVQAGLPRWITRLSPNLWRTVDAVRSIHVPVLVVHSDADELFPVAMAQRIAEACGDNGELLVVQGIAHNDPIFHPGEVYWRPVAAWIGQQCGSEVRSRRYPSR